MKKNYIAPEIEVVRFNTEGILADVLVQSGLNQDLPGVGGFDIFDDDGSAQVFVD